METLNTLRKAISTAAVNATKITEDEPNLLEIVDVYVDEDIYKIAALNNKVYLTTKLDDDALILGEDGMLYEIISQEIGVGGNIELTITSNATIALFPREDSLAEDINKYKILSKTINAYFNNFLSGKVATKAALNKWVLDTADVILANYPTETKTVNGKEVPQIKRDYAKDLFCIKVFNPNSLNPNE